MSARPTGAASLLMIAPTSPALIGGSDVQFAPPKEKAPAKFADVRRVSRVRPSTPGKGSHVESSGDRLERAKAKRDRKRLRRLSEALDRERRDAEPGR